MLQLTKTKFQQGVWQGIITGAGTDTPMIEVTHQGKPVQEVTLAFDEKAAHWMLSIPIPKEMIAEGVQTLIIHDKARNQKLDHLTLVAGEVLGDDILAEMDVLRAELDLLKSAFRRHCVDSH
ncbi:MAG: hypothetical protein ACJAVM_001104 [Sulfitobacter sp.]|jgi:hypothetical protein